MEKLAAQVSPESTGCFSQLIIPLDQSFWTASMPCDEI